MADGDDFNGKIISEFRANGGNVGGFFEGQPMLLLHHNGAKTGAERVNPLVYQQVGSSYAVFGSAGGQPRDPQWFRNLIAHPDVTAEIGTSTVRARARSGGGARAAARSGPPPPRAAFLPGPTAPVAPGPAPDAWLPVNVFSPGPGGSGLPVMVRIYGGGYRFGVSSQVVYDGTALARQNVVVVTFNHRVGVEGYAYLPGVPANRGLLDQVAALRWVQENIAAFGGEADQVTVFGESSGAGAIASLLVMPAAAGLFRR